VRSRSMCGGMFGRCFFPVETRIRSRRTGWRGGCWLVRLYAFPPCILHLSALTKVTTQHARTLVAFILDPPPDQQLTDLSARLNNPSSTAIHSTLSDLIRAIQSPSNARTETPPPRDTQYIHSTSNPPRFASSWKSHELVSAPTIEPSISGKSRPRREVTVDALGVCAREALISYVPFPSSTILLRI
jgi:hypothetical protein